MERRELFSFLSTSIKDAAKEKEDIVLRPPYCKDLSVFDKGCQECDGKCATLCQEQIIVIGKDKTPYLDLSVSGCTYCDDCAIGCEYDVLKLEDKTTIATNVVINTNLCMSWDGVMCFSCKDPCLEDAIIFKGMFTPSIDQDKCTSCGFCISRCPSYAIKLEDLK